MVTYDEHKVLTEDFHKQRRCFVIISGRVEIMPEWSTLSHKEWFKLAFPYIDTEVLMTMYTRGYSDLTGLYYYRDYNFMYSRADTKDILRHLPELIKELNLLLDLRVYAGVIPSDEGKRYEPKDYKGTIEDLLKRSILEGVY